MTGTFDDPRRNTDEDAAMPYQPGPVGAAAAARSAIERIRDRHEQRLLAIDGVEGIGLGRSRIGDDLLVVYVQDASVAQRLPRTIEGYDVDIVVTQGIDAL